jgi:hypothetical protein
MEGGGEKGGAGGHDAVYDMWSQRQTVENRCYLSVAIRGRADGSEPMKASHEYEYREGKRVSLWDWNGRGRGLEGV